MLRRVLQEALNYVIFSFLLFIPESAAEDRALIPFCREEPLAT
jgi:hypothetical protein